MNPEVKGSIRHLLTLLGGVLVARGWFDAEGLEQAINLVEVFGGAAISLGSLIWSIKAKRAASVEAEQIATKVKVAAKVKAQSVP